MKKTMLIRTCALIVFALVVTACGGSDEDSTGETNDTQVQASNESEDVTNDASSNDEGVDDQASNTETVIPEGAIAASEDFPFPVPEGWTARDPFTAERIGDDEAMTASYEFADDFDTAADLYSELLRESGFQSDRNTLGEMTNDASLMVQGVVDGVAYKGSIDFNTHAEGYRRAVINLVVQ